MNLASTKRVPQVVAVLLFVFVFVVVSASWFDNGYEYRHNITQTNTSQSLFGLLNGTSLVDEGIDGSDHWVYGTWRGGGGEFLDVYHQDSPGGGWDDAKVASESTEYCLVHTLPTNYTNCVTTPSGLRAFYAFDETGNKAWDHIGDNHGTIQSAVTQNLAGPSGKAYDFDGSSSSYVTVPHNPDINFSSAMTIAAWLKFDGTGSFVTWVDKADSSNNQLAYRFGLDDTNKFRFAFWDSAVTKFDVLSDNTISTGQWYHVVGVFDGSNMYLYINGTQQTDTETSISSTINTNNQDMVIGANQQGTAGRVNGQIAQLRLYDRALSTAEVKALYFRKSGLGAEESRSVAGGGWSQIQPSSDGVSSINVNQLRGRLASAFALRSGASMNGGIEMQGNNLQSNGGNISMGTADILCIGYCNE